MRRHAPLWLLAIGVGLALAFTVAFGWAVMTTVEGDGRSGLFGRIAVRVASLPRLLGGTDAPGGDVRHPMIQVAREPLIAYDGFAPIPAAPGQAAMPGLLMRIGRARLTPGWRMAVGAFEIGGAPANAAALISPDLEIVHVWRLGEAGRAQTEILVHGLAVFPDGALIVAFEGGRSLQRIDRCGGRVWSVAGPYRYAVNPTDAGDAVWTIRGDEALQEIAASDGAILRTIRVADIIAANPKLDILEVRREAADALGRNPRDEPGRWRPGAIGLNDVDPLPSARTGQFHRLDAGDLLVSARALNLLFVLDPKTLGVKWWRMGQTRGQHDPDWLADGRIAVIDNRPARHDSEVIAITPLTYERSVLYDGRRDNIYSRVRGKQEWHGNGLHLLASPQQGRALEMDDGNVIVLEIANLAPGDAPVNYVLTEFKWLPPDFFDPPPTAWACPDR